MSASYPSTAPTNPPHISTCQNEPNPKNEHFERYFSWTHLRKHAPKNANPSSNPFPLNHIKNCAAKHKNPQMRPTAQKLPPYPPPFIQLAVARNTRPRSPAQRIVVRTPVPVPERPHQYKEDRHRGNKEKNGLQRHSVATSYQAYAPRTPADRLDSLAPRDDKTVSQVAVKAVSEIRERTSNPIGGASAYQHND